MGNLPLRPTETRTAGAGETAAYPPSATEAAGARARELEVRVAELERELDVLRSSQARAGEERMLLERQAIMESIPDGLAMIDRAGQVIYQNRASLELHGYASVEEACLPQANPFKVPTS
jgi:PAS domain-containing protein